MFEQKDLETALQLLLDGKELEERTDLDSCQSADPVLRELQKLGVALSIRQQRLGDCLARVYHLPADKRHAARRIQANLKPKANIAPSSVG